jgi:hypothetical protein
VAGLSEHAPWRSSPPVPAASVARLRMPVFGASGGLVAEAGAPPMAKAISVRFLAMAVEGSFHPPARHPA